jgi:hypothetical protein
MREDRHGIGRGVPVIGAPVHFAAGDDIDSGGFLIQNCGLRGAMLGVAHIRLREHPCLDLLFQ